MIFNVNIERRVATLQESAETIVCDNSGYSITFTFDEEWAEYPNRTARFKWNNKHQDVEFTGNTVEIPPITNTRTFTVGVYCGESAEGEPQISTTDVKLPCLLSVRCGDSKPNGESGESYTNEARGYAEAARASAEEAQTLVDGFDRDLDDISAHVSESEDTLRKLNAECERSVGTDGQVYCILERNPYEESVTVEGVETDRMYGITEMIMSGYVNWTETGGTARSSYFETNITRQVQGIQVGRASTLIVSGVVVAKTSDGLPAEPKLYAIKVSIANACFTNDIQGLQHPDNYSASQCLGAFAMNFNGAWVYDHETGWKEASASGIKVRTIMPRILDQR